MVTSLINWIAERICIYVSSYELDCVPGTHKFEVLLYKYMQTSFTKWLQLMSINLLGNIPCVPHPSILPDKPLLADQHNGVGGIAEAQIPNPTNLRKSASGEQSSRDAAKAGRPCKVQW